MAEPRYSRTSFWAVKVVGLLALLIVIWNIAKESGRQEILGKRAVQAIINDNPVCVWGGIVYPATALNTKKMTITIKRDRDQGGN